MSIFHFFFFFAGGGQLGRKPALSLWAVGSGERLQANLETTKFILCVLSCDDRRLYVPSKELNCKFMFCFSHTTTKALVSSKLLLGSFSLQILALQYSLYSFYISVFISIPLVLISDKLCSFQQLCEKRYKFWNIWRPHNLMQVLFQPRIMPNIPSPQHTTIQQQFSPGFFSSPPHSVILPAFPGFVSLSSSREQAIHHQSSQPQPSTGNGKLTATPIREPLTKQGVSQPLNCSAVPFIPLQVWYLVQITI